MSVDGGGRRHTTRNTTKPMKLCDRKGALQLELITQKFRLTKTATARRSLAHEGSRCLRDMPREVLRAL